MRTEYFRAESILTYRVMGTLALCCRTLGQEKPAPQIEDEIVKTRIQEGIDVSRGTRYRRLKAAVIMEASFNAYKRREWYTETVRLFEKIIDAFKVHFDTPFK